MSVFCALKHSSSSHHDSVTDELFTDHNDFFPYFLQNM